MTKPTTHVLLITDQSGSMAPLADDVRGGFNTYIDGLRADGGKYRLTVTLFDDQFQTLCRAADLADVPALDRSNYRPRGMTALLDAVGKTVTEFEAGTSLADGDRVLVVVQTDGHENSSREFRREQIAAMVREREADGRWSFVFLGAGIDAWAQARDLGFDRGSTVSVAATGAGTRTSYDGLTRATRAYSKGASAVDTSAVLADALSDESGQVSK